LTLSQQQDTTMYAKCDENIWRRDVAAQALARKSGTPKHRKTDTPHPFTRSRPVLIGIALVGISALAGALHFGGAL
jgi:hypothetical protein